MEFNLPLAIAAGVILGLVMVGITSVLRGDPERDARRIRNAVEADGGRVTLIDGGKPAPDMTLDPGRHEVAYLDRDGHIQTATAQVGQEWGGVAFSDDVDPDAYAARLRIALVAENRRLRDTLTRLQHGDDIDGELL